MAKNMEMSYLLDFYGDTLTKRQQGMLEQYYYDDLSLCEIGENFGITRQAVRDAIKHGEAAMLELEQQVGFAARYRDEQEKLAKMEDIIKKARFANTGAYGGYTPAEFVQTLDSLLDILHQLQPAEET